MKSLMLLMVLGAMFMGGCACKDYAWYPKDTFIGASGWPSAQVPVGTVREQY